MSARAAAQIVVRGAREHNLRGFDLRIPRDQLVVLTGLSGSGKSSLAFDTLYAEGQRRYLESLSLAARPFLEQLPKPAVDSIEGLSPTLALEQHAGRRNPRSTVGTITEVNDYLRLLYARVGRAHCPKCEQPLKARSPEQLAARVLARLTSGTALELFAPVVRGRRGAFRAELDALYTRGFRKARIDGVRCELKNPPRLAPGEQHEIAVLVERLEHRGDDAQREGEAPLRARCSAALERALRISKGHALIVDDAGEEWLSRRCTCGKCGAAFPELTPGLFSFNRSPGACTGCNGRGQRDHFDPRKLVPDPERSLRDGAIAPWGGRRMGRGYRRLLEGLAQALDFELDTPWRKLPVAVRRKVLHGTGQREIALRLPRRLGGAQRRPFEGVIGELERQRRATGKTGQNEIGEEALAKYARSGTCPDCAGTRLSKYARSVRVGGRGIHELAALPLDKALHFLETFSQQPEAGERAIAHRVLAEVCERLRFLCDLGLGYLTLARAADSLSGGEAQRTRLGAQLGARLFGVLYVLDEPSIGLHARDNERLLESLKKLRDDGNSVLVVEHDEATIRSADHLIDMGPGAGEGGGGVVAEGPPTVIMRSRASLTGAYLAGRRRIALPSPRPLAGAPLLELRGCRAHNLKNINLTLPLGRFCVVTGVSGSGKSTLIGDTLHLALARKLQRAEVTPGAHESLRGAGQLERVIAVDQTPIGRTPRSNPLTYTGAFDAVRRLFAGVPEARLRGYGAGRFSFNVKGGRCETCRGDGGVRVEMHFLPDLFVRCERCRGRRYNRETLEVRYREKSIADVLELSVEEGHAFFANIPGAARPLATLKSVGLGYLRLGQPATALSGGEAQRIRLARELSKSSQGGALYLFDEPTTGLHFEDVARLLEVLQQLVERGNTVVVVEHHLDIIRSADFVLDLGPEGGDAGGAIVASGTPEEIAQNPASHTGRALREAAG